MGTSQKMVLDRAQSALAMLGGISTKAIVTLVVCIGLGVVGIYFATTINSDIPLSGSGSLALIIGVTFSLIVGVGLMALIFFSSRIAPEKDPERVARGKLGGAKGGRLRAEKLSPERRREIAQAAARARCRPPARPRSRR